MFSGIVNRSAYLVVMMALLPACSDPGGNPAGPQARLYVLRSFSQADEDWLRIEQSSSYKGVSRERQATRGTLEESDALELERLTDEKRLALYEADALPLDRNGEPGELFPRYWVVVNPPVPPYEAELDAYFGAEVETDETREFLTFVSQLFAKYADGDEPVETSDGGLMDASPVDAAP